MSPSVAEGGCRCIRAAKQEGGDGGAGQGELAAAAAGIPVVREWSFDDRLALLHANTAEPEEPSNGFA